MLGRGVEADQRRLQPGKDLPLLPEQFILLRRTELGEHAVGTPQYPRRSPSASRVQRLQLEVARMRRSDTVARCSGDPGLRLQSV